MVFATLYRIVLGGPESIGAGGIAWLLMEETGGGVLFGLVLGYGLYRRLRSINHYQTEVILTLSAVRGGYLLAQCLHVSGPLAMVVAGLLVGARAREDAMSHQTEEYADKF